MAAVGVKRMEVCDVLKGTPWSSHEVERGRISKRKGTAVDREC